MIIRDRKVWYGIAIFSIIIGLAFLILAIGDDEKQIPQTNVDSSIPSDDDTYLFSQDQDHHITAALDDFAPNDVTENIVTNDPVIGHPEVKSLPAENDPLFEKLVQQDVAQIVDDANQQLALKKHLAEVIESDLARHKKWDLPPEIIPETPSDQLLLHFIKTPMTANLEFYMFMGMDKDFEIGIRRALNGSVTLEAFYDREDLAEGALKMYREFDLSPHSMSDAEMIDIYTRTKANRENPMIINALKPENLTGTKIARISNNLQGADMILLSPQFFSRLKGHEREFLEVLVSRYDKICQLREIYGQDKYGLAMQYLPRLCRRLVQELDASLYDKIKDVRPVGLEGKEKFYGAIKLYLEK